MSFQASFQQKVLYAYTHQRLISTVLLLRGAVLKGCFTVLTYENVSQLLQDCIDMLWRRLACKSEWITCRLQSL
jgi:hypothetical protein